MANRFNLFNYAIPDRQESFTTLLEHKNIKIVRIVSSDDLEADEYCQEEDEWVVLLKGEAEMEIEGERQILKCGETLFIPAHTHHKVIRTVKDTLWLAVHIY